MSQQGAQSSPGDRPDVAELVDRLSRFQGPPQEFLRNLLEVQCRLSGAEAGAILAPGQDGQIDAVAAFPQLRPGAVAPTWLSRASQQAREVIDGGKTVVRELHEEHDLYGQPARRRLVMIPIRGGASGVRGLAVFVLQSSDPAAVEAGRERLELTGGLLSLYEMRLTVQQYQADLTRLREANKVLTAVNEHDRFAAAGMALCNETASRWGCERVSFGVLKGRYVQLKAMSHTEKFSRKMQIVQDIEAAMEECLDQDVEVLVPPAAEDTSVSRAAEELARRHGPETVLSIPLRSKGEPWAVVTLERPPETPFSGDEVESLRLTCDLISPRLNELHARDRWFGARAAAALRDGLAAVVGPRHTWIKAAAVGVFAAVMFLIFAKGTYNADCPFVLEATTRQAVSAPFEAELAEVLVETGDKVVAGETVLARLDTLDIRRTQLPDARARLREASIQASVAMRDGKVAEAQMARAQADQARAQIELFERRLEQAEIVSKVTGTVIVGDLRRRIGSRVSTGDELFEIATVESLRAELGVSEDQVSDVRTGMEGELAVEGAPDRRVRFTLTRISPIATTAEERHVFKARAELDDVRPWMRPGMEGLAKIEIDRRSYAWIWTRKVRNWLRMKLWL
ncbi:MAG: efflux RND transporter periplasmic adaptor subunit [Planctomycetota bacterium]